MVAHRKPGASPLWPLHPCPEPWTKLKPQEGWSFKQSLPTLSLLEYIWPAQAQAPSAPFGSWDDTTVSVYLDLSTLLAGSTSSS